MVGHVGRRLLASMGVAVHFVQPFFHMVLQSNSTGVVAVSPVELDRKLIT